MAKTPKFAIADEFGALQWTQKLQQIGTAVQIFPEEDKSILRVGAGEEVRICVLGRTRLDIRGAKANVYKGRRVLVKVATDVTDGDIATITAFRLVGQGH